MQYFQGPSQPGQKVKLSLYYESLCPYCKKFITEQLGPNFAKFEDYLDVHLNPFGNAHMKKHGDSYKFTCQHGEGECKGSIMEGCLLNRLNKGTDNAAVPTIACIEKSHPEVASTTQKVIAELDFFQIKISSDLLYLVHGRQRSNITQF